MIKAIAVIIVMLAVNAFMVFAIVKASGRLDDSLRRYFVTKVGSSEYSVIPMRNSEGTLVGGGGDGEEVKGKTDPNAEAEYFDQYGNVKKGDEGIPENNPYSGYGGKQNGSGQSSDGAGGAAGSKLQKKEKEVVSNYQQFGLERNSVTKEYVHGENGEGNGLNAGGSFRIPMSDSNNLIPRAEESNAARYKNSDLKDDYRVIKQLGLLDKEYAVRMVMDAQTEEGSEKGRAIRGMMDILNYDDVFALINLPSESQISVLRECFDKEQNAVFDEYLQAHQGKFDAIGFYGYIQSFGSLSDPEFYVYTGMGNEKIGSYGQPVETRYDPQIAEGIKVVYKDKLYDYSI